MINEKCPICNKGKIVIDDIIDIQELNLETKKAQVKIKCHCDKCQEIYFANTDYTLTESKCQIYDHFNAIK